MFIIFCLPKPIRGDKKSRKIRATGAEKELDAQDEIKDRVNIN